MFFRASSFCMVCRRTTLSHDHVPTAFLLCWERFFNIQYDFIWISYQGSKRSVDLYIDISAHWSLVGRRSSQWWNIYIIIDLSQDDSLSIPGWKVSSVINLLPCSCWSPGRMVQYWQCCARVGLSCVSTGDCAHLFKSLSSVMSCWQLQVHRAENITPQRWGLFFLW